MLSHVQQGRLVLWRVLTVMCALGTNEATNEKELWMATHHEERSIASPQDLF